MTTNDHGKIPLIIGWREWVSLPELGIKRIKAKADTGARTSALHAFQVERFTKAGKDRVRFFMHPFQYNTQVVIECVADLFDERLVSDSGGHREKRFVIQTPITLGKDIHLIDITLTNRDTMKFRMLLGRTALKNHFVVNPAISYTQGKP